MKETKIVTVENHIITLLYTHERCLIISSLVGLGCSYANIYLLMIHKLWNIYSRVSPSPPKNKQDGYRDLAEIN